MTVKPDVSVSLRDAVCRLVEEASIIVDSLPDDRSGHRGERDIKAMWKLFDQFEHAMEIGDRKAERRACNQLLSKVARFMIRTTAFRVG